MVEPTRARGPIGWGDAVTAAAALGIGSPETLGMLVDLLGLTVEAVGKEQTWGPTPQQDR